MISLSEDFKLPQYPQSDLDFDFEAIEQFDGLKLIWLLRTDGTVLVPIQMGVNPIDISYWLWSTHGQKVIPFLIDTTTGLIEKIDFEQAEKLIMKMPCVLSVFQDKQGIINHVNDVLKKGAKLHIWGAFKPLEIANFEESWKEWQDHFFSIGNRLMFNFMEKAIRLTHLH